MIGTIVAHAARIAGIGLLLFTAAMSPSRADGYAPSAGTPQILVRILELTGIGPDEKTHRLYSDPAGYVTTLDGLGRIGSQVSATGLADGAYHTLHVQLHDEYRRILDDGSTQAARFSDSGKPTRLRIRGMIMIEGESAAALRMFEHASYYGEPSDTSRRRVDDWDD